MRTLLKALGAILLLLILFVLGGLCYFFFVYPEVEAPPEITIEITPQRLERGKYLAHNVSLCIDCHSERNWDYFAGPIRPETLGAGGEVFDESMEIPGRIVSPNVTPYVLGQWTDGEIIRAVTKGISKDGTALFPLMPYHSYANFTDEDLSSIIAYMRTLPPIARENEPRRLNFPVNLLVRSMPSASPPKLVGGQSPSDLRGAYLTTIAGCGDCHTPMERGQRIAGLEFAGGMRFELPDGNLIYSANITPDETTGIGNWSREDFITRFKMYDSSEASSLSPDDMGFNTPMPWLQYAGMTEEDLGLIYDYLRSIPAIRHASESDQVDLK